MGKIDGIIEDLKSLHKGLYRPWIYDEDGNMKDNVICGDIILLLGEIKEYEVDWTDEQIQEFINDDDVESNNTYNWNSNINHDINYHWKKDSPFLVMMIHRAGDVRGNYTDYFVIEADDAFEHPLCWLYEFDSSFQHKDFGGHYVADINLFSETYSVYDLEKGDDIGEYYAIEVEDLLEEINNAA